MTRFTEAERLAFITEHFTGTICNHCRVDMTDGPAFNSASVRQAYHLARVHNLTIQRVALIYEDRLSQALGHGRRFVVKIAGKPDGERTTFKSALALARRRGATHYVISDNSMEIKPADKRRAL